MKKIHYNKKFFGETFMKIKNVILLGIIAIAITLFFSYKGSAPIKELTTIMITFLGIIFGFFMINLVHWMNLKDYMYDKSIKVIADTIGKQENVSASYYISPPELLEKAKKDFGANIEISNALENLELIRGAKGWFKKSFMKIILLLVFFIIGSILFIYLENLIPINYKTIIFSLIFILFIFIFQEILISSIFIHFPKITSKLTT